MKKVLSNRLNNVKRAYYASQAETILQLENIKNGTYTPSMATKVTVAIICFIMAIFCSVSIAFGATNLFDKAFDMIDDLYRDIIGISTAIMALIVVISFLWASASPSERKAEQAISWAKRAIVCWLVIMLLGSIIKLFQTLTNGGGYTPSKTKIG